MKLYESYDPNVIIQLVNNHRSHKEIVNVANTLYYENKLKSFGYQDKTIIQLWSKFAPEKFCPITFIETMGKEVREKPNKSLYNQLEIETVISKIQELRRLGLSQENIGVITPFSTQCRKIQYNLKKINLLKIEVGTTEQFQGREKEVIIFSAVRSKVFKEKKFFHIGFLSNPKRNNVIMTRAKALMIVIGNSEVLKYDNNWLFLINSCIKNSGYKGNVPKKIITKPENCLDDNKDPERIGWSNSLKFNFEE